MALYNKSVSRQYMYDNGLLFGVRQVRRWREGASVHAATCGPPGIRATWHGPCPPRRPASSFTGCRNLPAQRPPRLAPLLTAMAPPPQFLHRLAPPSAPYLHNDLHVRPRVSPQLTA